MNFKELGELLRSERERKGLSVGDVMEVTRISRCNIEAIERGDSSDLPFPVYAKGFVRNYARFLGIDAGGFSEIIGREYGLENNPGKDSETDMPVNGENAFSSDEPIVLKKSSKLTTLLIVFLVALLIALVAYWNKTSLTTTAGEEKKVAEASEPATESGVEPPAVEVEAESKVVEFPPVLESEPVETVESAEPVAQDQVLPQVADGSANATESGAGEQSDVVAMGSGSQTLLIVADDKGECWIQVLGVDGDETVFDFILSEGAKREIRFSNSLKIKLGNASAVSVFHNGEPFQAYPGYGVVVRTLTFPPS